MARGRYTKPSDRSGGSVGASISIASYGDIQVSGVVEVDISPADVSLNYDAEDNDLGVSGEIGMGSVVSVGGGVEIDLDTGSISGGSASLGFGGGEVEVSISQCETALQISYWGLGVAISRDTCGSGGGENDGDDNEDISQPPAIPPSPNNDASKIPNKQGFVVFESASLFTWTLFLDNIAEWKGTQTQLDKNKTSYQLPVYYSFDDANKTSKNIAQHHSTTRTTSGTGPCIDPDANNYWEGTSYILSGELDRLVLSNSSSFPYGNYSAMSKTLPGAAVEVYYTNNMKALVEWVGVMYPPSVSVFNDNYSIKGVVPSLCSVGQTGFSVGVSFKLVGWFPRNFEDANTDIKSTLRRPLYPELMDKQCCDASISLLRKIAKVLAVDKLLEESEPKKISTQTVADFKVQYDELVEQLPEGQKPKIIFDNYLGIKIYEMAVGGNAKIDDIHSVLRADELLLKGMKIPNELIITGGQDYSTPKDYPSILKCFVQMVDLSTIQPFTAVLQDSDPAEAGDQTMTKFYPDATSAVKEIVELLLENKVDSATRLNIQIRQSISAIQTMVAVLETLSIAYTIMYGLGLPFRQKRNTFVAPFDISPDPKSKKKGKGFNPKDEKGVESAINSLNENKEDITEKLLPDFLTEVYQEYLHTHFNDKHESLWYYIMSVFMKL